MEKFQSIIEQLSKENPKAIRKLIESLELLYTARTKAAQADDYEIMCCPICGSIHFKKNGTDKNGRQRFLCKDCNHTFGSTNNSILYRSKISKETWMKFIDCEIAHMPLSEEAYQIKYSVTTCFYMRQKLNQAASMLMEQSQLSGSVEVDSGYFKINLKGTKPDKMPRMSKKRGNKSAYSGISHHKVCVACAIDENDETVMRIVGLGSESFAKYMKIAGNLEKAKTVISDSKACFQPFCNELGAVSDRIPKKPNQKRYTTDNGNNLGDANELIEGYRTSIKCRHGIGTRYQQGYMDFYQLHKKMKRQYERKELTEALFNRLNQCEYLTHAELIRIDMPISLKEAYYEYRYGIFVED